jgi:hypothetical protein
MACPSLVVSFRDSFSGSGNPMQPTAEQLHIAYRRLLSLSIDPTAIQAIPAHPDQRADIALAFVQACGALRRADLSALMKLSEPTISRLVATLLSSGQLREQIVKDGTMGRPTGWLVMPECTLPSLDQRQATIACIPDILIP